jgi:hypothetical protein
VRVEGIVILAEPECEIRNEIPKRLQIPIRKQATVPESVCVWTVDARFGRFELAALAPKEIAWRAMRDRQPRLSFKP